MNYQPGFAALQPGHGGDEQEHTYYASQSSAVEDTESNMYLQLQLKDKVTRQSRSCREQN